MTFFLHILQMDPVINKMFKQDPPHQDHQQVKTCHIQSVLSCTHKHHLPSYTPLTHLWAMINGLQCRVDFLEVSHVSGQYLPSYMITTSHDDLPLQSIKQNDIKSTSEIAIEIGKEGEARLVQLTQYFHLILLLFMFRNEED